MDPRVGLRRDPVPDLDDVGEDAALADRIRAEIRATGPMPFARFMDLALYDPDGGYYRSADARPGRAGDFLTAPELHPIFGATLMTGLHEIWVHLGRPSPFVIREHGAGTGALAVAILDAIDDPAFRAALRYQPVEVDARRVETFRARLADAGHADAVDDATTEPVEGIVLANEVLDALPVHRLRRRGDRLLELAVDVDGSGAFVEREIEPPTPEPAARLDAEGITVADGQSVEVCLALDAWIAGAAAGLRRGVLLLIDYGHPAGDLYDPVRRRDGTLLAYLQHRAHTDPLAHVGRQDLTAHVDLTAVARAAEAVGLTKLGSTTQAEALMGLGIQERLRAIQADPATTPEAYLLVRAALLRLLDPAAMGRFRVLAFGRDWPTAGPDDAPLGLFAFRLPARPRGGGQTPD